MKRAAFVLLTFALVGTLTACGLGDSPEKAAQEWMQAFANLDGNKIADRTCVAQQANVQQVGLWSSVFNLFGQQTIGQQAKTAVSGLKYTTVSSSGSTANVRVIGQIRVAVLALSQTQDIDETWRMVQEDGKWKWCGQTESSSLPKTDTSSKPSSRTFTSTDLSRLVLQQSESALPLQESGDSLGDIPWSEMVSQWRAVGVQTASFRIYKDRQQQYIASSAILFTDLAGATQGFQIIADFTRKSQTLTPLSGLGDEGLGFVVQRPDGTIVGYTWRVNNVLLELIIGGKDIDEEYARTLADKMQSHTK